MYARDLMFWLHERLANISALDQTQRRFESLRGYNLLPRGRENAGVRLSNEQVASAVLGFAHPAPGFAGHASLILGDLRPVGGPKASFKAARDLRSAIATLIETGDINSDLARLTVCVEQGFTDTEYTAVIYFREDGKTRTVSFVSKYAYSLLGLGAEVGYDHEKLDQLTAVQRSFGSEFFRDLSRAVSISRLLDRPFKTDWLEYETEEEKAEFYRKLGARLTSQYMNLRVEAQVTWPREPTKIEFSGRHLVLFPKTKDYSHSVSIDLLHERISADDARSLVSRMLSVMSWCDDQPASVHEGWSGSPVPMPVPRQNLASMTTHEWHFYRTIPDNEDLMRCLAYYRDGLNAYSVGLASHAVVSFYRVFETRHDTKPKAIKWVNAVFSNIESFTSKNALQAFEADRQAEGVDHGKYVYENCRVATAHAARDFPSDPDAAHETRRLLRASQIIQSLARYFIIHEFKFSTSYFADDG